ncbi:hypothetical protein RN001_008966 [Aquatica leii]|uniref:Uncharacterized protein n=1 Tax=Aquatica leii TaxID=1421715 RepID=A0AAN7Q5J2_9COLE|nr:hypothetical protein RN001_008966 [Aquatica leii]
MLQDLRVSKQLTMKYRALHNYQCKMYSVIEFSDEEGGGVAIVHCKWFTPRKKEVFWPPYKDPNAFNRALIKGVDVSEDWKLFKINRNFYETDDLEKAKRKLKLSELTSDLNTDAEEKLPARRLTKKPRRIIESSDDDEEISKFERPPKIVKVTAKKITEKTREGAPLQEDIVDTLRCQRQDYINKNFYNSPISSSATYDSTPNFTSRFSLATRENSRLTPHSEIEQSVQGQILKHLVILREQNEQILLTLQKFSKERSQHITTSVPKFPVSLPLSDLENLKEFENYLLNEQNLSATDIEEIQRILEDDSDDPASVEDLGEESDIASEDAVEERKLDSETDQEGVGNDEKEEELTSKEEKVVEHIGDSFFLGKISRQRGLKIPSPPASRRVQRHNIITHLPGVKEMQKF